MMPLMSYLNNTDRTYTWTTCKHNIGWDQNSLLAVVNSLTELQPMSSES